MHLFVFILLCLSLFSVSFFLFSVVHRGALICFALCCFVMYFIMLWFAAICYCVRCVVTMFSKLGVSNVQQVWIFGLLLLIAAKLNWNLVRDPCHSKGVHNS